MTCGGNVVFNKAFFLACGGFPTHQLFRELGGEDGALFGGVGLELIALGCGVCYMLSGTHGLLQDHDTWRYLLPADVWRCGEQGKHHTLPDFGTGEAWCLPR